MKNKGIGNENWATCKTWANVSLGNLIGSCGGEG